MTNAKYLAIVVLGVALFALIAPVYAASMSITSVTIPTSVNLGESFTIAAQLTSSGVNTGQAQLSGSPLPTQISCTPTSAQSVTLSGGSGSASWNCTGSVAGDYSNGITVTVTDADGQAPQATSQTGLTVLAPPLITVGATTSSSSVDFACAASSTFNYTVAVNNAGDTDATGIAVTPSVSGMTTGYSLDTSSYSSQTVPAKSLKNFNFRVTVTATGTLNFVAITVTSTNAGSGTTTARSVSITNTTTSCYIAPTPTSTSAGTSYVAPTAVQESTTIDTIPAGTTKTVTVTKAAETGVKAIKIAVKNTVTSVKITTSQVASLPSTIPSAPVPATTGGVYKYVDITATNVQSGDVDKVTISFQVEKSWVTANGINAATIALQRWADNKWNKLTSAKTSEDSTYYYFDAESPGLSTFAITGEKVAATPTATPTVTVTAPTATPTATPTPAGISIPIIPGQPPVQIPTWLIVVAIAIIAAYFIYKKKMPSATGERRYSYQQKK